MDTEIIDKAPTPPVVAGPEPKAVGASPAGADQVCDVFISYSSQDRDWVKSDLIQILKAHNLSYWIDYERIKPGTFINQVVSEAVLSCKHVLLALTPSWVDRPWTRVETNLAISSDLLGQEGRVVPVLCQECTLPPYLFGRLYLDLTILDPGRRREEEAKLVAALGLDLPPPDPRLTRSDLLNRLRSSNNPARIAIYGEAFRSSLRLIGQIGDFKKLHDDFHDLITICDLVGVWQKDIPGDWDKQSPEARDDSFWDRLDADGPTLNGRLDALIDDAKGSPNCSNESWVLKLARANGLLEQAVAERSLSKLTAAMRDINTEKDQKLTRFNQRLLDAARILDLTNLRKSLSEVRSGLVKGGETPDEGAAQWLGKFDGMLDELVKIEPDWKGLIENHNRLQEIDEAVKGLREPKIEDLDLFCDEWQMVAAGLRELTLVGNAAARQLGPLRADAVKIETAAQQERDPSKVNRLVKSFRSKQQTFFYSTDQDVKNICPKMVEFGNQLNQELEMGIING